jgi:hypothetical protein
LQSKNKQTSKPKRKKSNTDAPSSGEESDGLSALKAVEEVERTGGGKRGPALISQQHWHPPMKLIEPGLKSLRWQFKCRYCDKYVLAYVLEKLVILTFLSDVPEAEQLSNLPGAMTLMMRGLSQKLETLEPTPALLIQKNGQALVMPSQHQQHPLIKATQRQV